MPQRQTHHQRIIPMQGIYNLRDLGGLPTRDGRQIRTGHLYRSDSLHHIPEQSKRQLMGLGIRTVIDLRRNDELAHPPHALQMEPDVQYHHVALRLVPYTDRQPFTLTDLYLGIIRNNTDLIRDVFDHLFARPEGVVFHCRAGKDRTGVIAAILLDWLGVDHDTIVDDYALTDAFIQPILPELQAERPPSIPKEHYDQLLETHPHAIRTLLEDLQERYGGSSGFLQSIGFQAESLNPLRNILTECTEK